MEVTLGSVAEVGWIRQLMRESVGDSRSSWRIFQHDLDAKVSPCGRTPLSWNSFMSGGAGMGTAGELSDGSPRRPELLSASVGDHPRLVGVAGKWHGWCCGVSPSSA